MSETSYADLYNEECDRRREIATERDAIKQQIREWADRMSLWANSDQVRGNAAARLKEIAAEMRQRAGGSDAK